MKMVAKSTSIEELSSGSTSAKASGTASASAPAASSSGTASSSPWKLKQSYASVRASMRYTRAGASARDGACTGPRPKITLYATGANELQRRAKSIAGGSRRDAHVGRRDYDQPTPASKCPARTTGRRRTQRRRPKIAGPHGPREPVAQPARLAPLRRPPQHRRPRLSHIPNPNTLDIRAADARMSFSRIGADGGGQPVLIPVHYAAARPVTSSGDVPRSDLEARGGPADPALMRAV
ncbi:uncharacterized protein B0H18DRAFT_1137929 [Fomitopsis serialis]|uniref:uncharacterized protein n=1 Tax=Fomitopsis serialis TaxID=139415 RepID=UPI002008E65D|nr:uncharacterized protein B0H18DRAFT_1137929 [Neoantrodia serialis]KAH9916890.1 hypothetical protein B0H18DRAFT_1137929 [Neoantrodia serialis]